jgi:S1-C subfamily serine protease
VSGANVRIATRIVRHFDLPSAGAVHVADVAAESPAARAGVAAGDRIVALDGEPVDGIDSLQRLLDASRIGRSCELKLLRRAVVLSLSVQPIELPVQDG